MHETLLIAVITNGSETMLWKEKERPRIRAVQMENFRDLLGIRRMDRVPSAQIRELWEVTKGVDKKIEEDILRWIGHVERKKRDRIAKRVYVGECAGSRSTSRQRKKCMLAKQ